MSEHYSIKDERTVYCRKAMRANGGVWNPVTSEWLFRDAGDHANALCELYRVTRPSAPMRETLEAMVADGTGALAWGFDPAEQPLEFGELDRTEASKLIAAGYAVRRVLGVHPLEDAEPVAGDATADASELDRRSRRPRRRASVA